MRCLSCKYDLRNLTEHRCPECARAFDPDNSLTFQTDASRQQGLTKTFLWTTAIYVIAFHIFAIWLSSKYGLGFSGYALLAALAVILFSPAIVGYVWLARGFSLWNMFLVFGIVVALVVIPLFLAAFAEA